MKKVIVGILFGFAVQFAASAQLSSVALPFMETDRNPVTSAMAGASLLRSADASDVYASFQIWNPSSTSYFSAAGNFAIGEKVIVKANGTYGAGKPYDVSTGISSGTSRFKPSEMMFGAGLSYSFSGKIAVELGARYASAVLSADSRIGAFAADVIFRGSFGSFLVAAGAVNLGPGVSGSRIPSAAVLAVGYDLGKEGRNRLRPEIDAKYYFCGALGFSAGVDYTIGNIFSIRGGYHFGGIVAEHASVGLGVNIKGIHLDASYLIGSGVISNTLCFGMGYSF